MLAPSFGPNYGPYSDVFMEIGYTGLWDFALLVLSGWLLMALMLSPRVMEWLG